MKSPFPGMDPFIEADYWQDFHLSMIAEMKRQLVPQLPDKYQLTAELNVASRDFMSGDDSSYRPDVGIIGDDQTSSGSTEEIGKVYGVTTEPTTIRKKTETKQRYLTIRTKKSKKLITAIEVLSPTNKEGKGLQQYKMKRADYINSGTNLVEIDFLRGGRRPYQEAGLPYSVYQVVSVENGDIFKTWSIEIDGVLPTIPVPLAYGDAPLILNLQEVFKEVYAYSSYDQTYNLNELRPKPTLEEIKVLKIYIPVDLDV